MVGLIHLDYLIHLQPICIPTPRFSLFSYRIPIHREGQIVCICYAVVGLPIFGVFLSLLGDLLAEWFLNGYRKFSRK